MAKTPKNILFRKFFKATFLPLYVSMQTQEVSKSCYVFGPKMPIFAIFWWFLVQKHKFTNLATFANSLIAHISIFILKHLRIKSIFLLILAH